MGAPGYISDAVTDASLLGEFVKSTSSPHADPLTAYAAWTSGMAGSDTALVRVMDGDSTVFTSTPILIGGDIYGVVRPGSEGSFGIYKDWLGGSANTRSPLTAGSGSGQISFTRFYGPSRAPPLILTFSDPSVDTERRNGNYRVAGGVAVFYVRWSNNAWSTSVEAAIKLSSARVEVVALSNTGNTGNFYFQVFRAVSTVVSPVTLPVLTVGGSGSYIDSLLVGVTQHYLAQEPVVAPTLAPRRGTRRFIVLPEYRSFMVGKECCPPLVLDERIFAAWYAAGTATGLAVGAVGASGSAGTSAGTATNLVVGGYCTTPINFDTLGPGGASASTLPAETSWPVGSAYAGTGFVFSGLNIYRDGDFGDASRSGAGFLSMPGGGTTTITIPPGFDFEYVEFWWSYAANPGVKIYLRTGAEKIYSYATGSFGFGYSKATFDGVAVAIEAGFSGVGAANIDHIDIIYGPGDPGAYYKIEDLMACTKKPT